MLHDGPAQQSQSTSTTHSSTLACLHQTLASAPLLHHTTAPTPPPHAPQACEQAITLQLLPAADGSDGTTLQLRINSASTDQPHKASTSSSSDSSSSDEESDDPAAASEEPLDYEDMAALITKAYQQADEEDLGGDELLQQHGCQVEMGLPPVAPLEEEIRAEEPLEVAGKVTALLEGMVVVQCPENGRALLEGSVLCLEDRSAVGGWRALGWAVTCCDVCDVL